MSKGHIFKQLVLHTLSIMVRQPPLYILASKLMSSIYRFVSGIISVPMSLRIPGLGKSSSYTKALQAKVNTGIRNSEFQKIKCSYFMFQILEAFN